MDFPEMLRRGGIYTIEFYYSGHPVEMGRNLVNTACEEEGASVHRKAIAADF